MTGLWPFRLYLRFARSDQQQQLPPRCREHSPAGGWSGAAATPANSPAAHSPRPQPTRHGRCPRDPAGLQHFEPASPRAAAAAPAPRPPAGRAELGKAPRLVLISQLAEAPQKLPNQTPTDQLPAPPHDCGIPRRACAPGLPRPPQVQRQGMGGSN